MLTDVQGRDYYLWMDTGGNLRFKKGIPSSDKDGALIMTKGAGGLSPSFMQNLSVLLLLVAVLISGLVLYSIKKK